MNLEKICEALSEVDELGRSIKDGCLVGQLLLFYKSPEEIDKEIFSGSGRQYDELFDGLLAQEYSLNENQIKFMVNFNDSTYGTPKERHTRVLAHYEGLLIECLISQSSSQAEDESSPCEGVLIAR